MSKGTRFFLLEQIAFEDGAVAAGAKLYFYQTGTTTDQSVYQEVTLDTAHAQPVVAGSDGLFNPIFLDPDASVDYRVRLTDSDDNQIWQVDNVPRYRENFESGSASITWSGFSSDPSQTTLSWYRIGRMVSITIPVGTGTSDSTSFSLSGIPSAIRPQTVQYLHFPYAQDNGSHLTGGAVGQLNTNGVIDFAPADAAYSETGWTGSSTKGILTSGNAMYRLVDS